MVMVMVVLCDGGDGSPGDGVLRGVLFCTCDGGDRTAVVVDVF